MKKSTKTLVIVSILFVILCGTVMAARLPKEGEDNGNWGNILNRYLNVSLDENGTLRQGAIDLIYPDLDTNATDDITVEADPVFTASVAAGILGIDINNWNAAFGWGDHAAAGYLTAETDPVHLAWLASVPNLDIDSTDDITVEADPVFTAWDKSTGISVTESQISDLQAYLTAETDPKVSGGSANQAVCWKTSTTLGYCSDQPDASGTCTCN